MSILIQGMEMPKSCESCPCKTADAFGGLGCQATGYIPLRKANQDRPGWCPLIPVPPHGNLIDRDAFLAEQRRLYCENCAKRKGMKNGKMKFVYDIGDVPCRSCGYGDVLDDIENAPTVEPTHFQRIQRVEAEDLVKTTGKSRDSHEIEEGE